MPLRRRSSGPPDHVREVPEPGERVLAHGSTRGSTVVVATDRALYLPRREGGHDRLAWEAVATASWDDPSLEVVPVGARSQRRVIDLDDAGELPPTVRERVTATVVVSEHLTLDGDQGARISARRAPGGTDIHWNVVFDPGTDPRDPAVRAAADSEIARLKGDLGL